MKTIMMTYNFGTALEAVKNGKKIKRLGWNGQDQYITLGRVVKYAEQDGRVLKADHDTMGSAVLIFHGTQGIQVGWLASQSDLLSKDWMIMD